MAAEDLGIGRVRVRWMPVDELRAAAGMGGIDAFARSSKPGVIHVRDDLPEERAVLVAAHEVRHLWQYAHGLFDPLTWQDGKATGETDATTYGETFARLRSDEVRRRAGRDYADTVLADLAADLEDLAALTGKGCGCGTWKPSSYGKVFHVPAGGMKSAQTPDEWLAAQLQVRDKYERELCARPEHATAAACQLRTN